MHNTVGFEIKNCELESSTEENGMSHDETHVVDSKEIREFSEMDTSSNFQTHIV